MPKLRNRVGLYFIFPFWLRCNGGVARGADRLALHTRLAEALNSIVQGGEGESAVIEVMRKWTVKSLIDSGLPVSVRRRKSAVLRSHDRAIELKPFKEKALPLKIEVVKATERVTYFDLGLGWVELAIEVSCPDKAALQALSKLCVEARQIIRTDDPSDSCLQSLHGLSWLETSLQTAFRRFELHGDPAMDGDSTRRGRSRLLEAHCTALVLQEAESEGIEVGEDGVRVLLQHFTQSSDQPIKAAVEGADLQILHGYNGHAVFVPRQAAAADLTRRLRWLWSLSTVYWAALYELSEELYDAMIPISPRSDPEVLNAALERFRQLEKHSMMLQQEAEPVVFCDDALDQHVYGGVWRVWNAENVLRTLDRMSKRGARLIYETSRVRELAYEGRIQKLLVFIAFLSVASVIADVAGVIAGGRSNTAGQQSVYWATNWVLLLALPLIAAGAVLWLCRRPRPAPRT